MGKHEDLTGQKFGRLTVVGLEGRDDKRNYIWRCVCDCGNAKVLATSVLKSGMIRSCGCLKSEMARNRRGIAHHKLTETLNAMKARCNNPNHIGYKDYGENGITVCDEWANGKEGHDNFVRWALANGYKAGLSIDRIDNNKGYSPDNCRWVTRNIQNANRKPRNNTGVLGVYKSSDADNYTAVICVDHKQHHLGRFKTLEEAKKARKEAELKYYGFTLGGD